MSTEFAGTLRERILIERPTAQRTAEGRQAPGWEPVATCRAAIVVEGLGPEVDAMALSAMPRFRVTVRRRDGLAVGQRIRWRGREMLVRQKIEDPRRPDRIELHCEEVR
jgi:SPP1 family predicted phage head-tail adaptor